MSADDADVAQALDDMEEEFTAFGCYVLGHIGWGLNDGIRSPAEKQRLGRQVYEAFASRHRSKLVWSRWPLDLENAWPVEPGTPLDFDLDPDGDVNEPLLVVVAA
ncbi:hypothetical protein G5V58_01025 [Nocardioides anomalus]|uniref:Uncharacterized protein n=1 Tax=Nocardioides anomalus TaxID=2712223 RepID=A0A6G6W8K5_9ACTN|nr:hypothetical protein [Nocardioides anomalus]QIG41539.1 hypothetical protein G5V58_01025 [Nocardioides anomalus]